MTAPFLIVVGMGLVTFGIRLAPILLLGRVDLPALVRQGLRFVPPAVLTAIVGPALFRPAGPIDFTLGNDRLVAGVLAILIAWRSGNVLATLAAGMACLWLLQAL